MKRPRSIDIHPAAAAFPPLTEPELARLALEIKKHGLVNPIVLCDDKVLDGRGRVTACERAGVPARFLTYEGDDPIEFVIQANGGRALTPGQRAITAARVARAWKASRVSPDTSQVSGDTSNDASWRAARHFGLSRSTVCRAEKLVENATAETVAAVETGRLRVNEALRALDTGRRKQEKREDRLVAVAGAVERIEKRALRVRDDLRELCADPRARKMLDDTLQDLARELYAFADGSAYGSAAS